VRIDKAQMATQGTKDHNESVVKLETPAMELRSQEGERTYKVAGTSGVVYRIDLGSFSCTCPDWVERRVRFPFPDIRRACKHISLFLQDDTVAVLLPIPPENYRIGVFSIGNRKLFVLQKGENRWIDVYCESEYGGYTSHGYCMFEKRWANGDRPPKSTLIKGTIRSWLKSEPERDWKKELPPLPSSAVIARRRREQFEFLEHLKSEDAKLGCYVCMLKLDFPPAPPETVEVICPRCGIANVLTQSGRTNRPERMAIYRKYDGDLYSKRTDGLINNGPPEQRGELERAKRAELDLLLTEEKEIRRHLGLDI